MTKRVLLQIALCCVAAVTVLPSCKGHPPPVDTDQELFPTPRGLTVIRMLNLRSRIVSFRQANGHLPPTPGALAAPGSPDGEESALRDGWGHAIILAPVGASFELRSRGPDGMDGTSDDLRLREDDRG
jgi:hypothetical protein